jgi:cytochrome c-type biogenesis protein CcmH/NrfG
MKLRAWALALTLTALPALAEVSPELTSAIGLYKEKNYDAANTALLALEKQAPNDAGVQYYLGRVARKQKRNDEAVIHLEKATQLASDNSEYFLALGDAYGAIASATRSFGAAQRSGQALEQAVRLAPRSEEARAALIDFCRQAPPIVGGGMKRAYAQAAELQKLDPAAGARLLAGLHLGERRPNEAIAVCSETLREHPHDYSLLYLIGRISVENGTHLEEAAQALEECLTLPVPTGFPSHAAANVRLGQVYSKIGDFATARRHFAAALQEEPDNADAKTGLATLDALPPPPKPPVEATPPPPAA